MPRPIPLKVSPEFFACLGSILPVQSIRIGVLRFSDKSFRSKLANSLCPVIIIAPSLLEIASDILVSVLIPNAVSDTKYGSNILRWTFFSFSNLIIVSEGAICIS